MSGAAGTSSSLLSLRRASHSARWGPEGREFASSSLRNRSLHTKISVFRNFPDHMVVRRTNRYVRFSVSITKNTHLIEKMDLQVKCEMLNAFDRHAFGFHQVHRRTTCSACRRQRRRRHGTRKSRRGFASSRECGRGRPEKMGAL